MVCAGMGAARLAELAYSRRNIAAAGETAEGPLSRGTYPFIVAVHTLAIVGTDIAGNAISETIAPVSASSVETLHAFKTLVSITGAGWIIGGGAGTEDAIKIGTSESLGLPDKLSDTAQVLCASLAAVKEATAPAVVVHATTLAKNTVNLNSALNASAVKVYYLV